MVSAHTGTESTTHLAVDGGAVMTSPDQAISAEPDIDYEPLDDSIISQSPTRRVGDHIFVSVPGPVPIVTYERRRRNKK
jgi:hypothetical protein